MKHLLIALLFLLAGCAPVTQEQITKKLEPCLIRLALTQDFNATKACLAEVAQGEDVQQLLASYFNTASDAALSALWDVLRPHMQSYLSHYEYEALSDYAQSLARNAMLELLVSLLKGESYD